MTKIQELDKQVKSINKTLTIFSNNSMNLKISNDLILMTPATSNIKKLEDNIDFLIEKIKEHKKSKKKRKQLNDK